MLICNEGKEDKKYHIAYQINSASPTIPYCRMVGHLEGPVQVLLTNSKICDKCRRAAGLQDPAMTPGDGIVAALTPPVESSKEAKALELIRAIAKEARSDEAWWWRKKINEACREAGMEYVVIEEETKGGDQ